MNVDKKKAIAWIIMTVLLALLAWQALQIDKIDLIKSEGTRYERAKVVKIVKDNLQEDGNRYGNQTVLLLIQSGKLKGQTVQAQSPSSMMFGADCTVGMHVIAMVSVSGNTKVVNVYARNRQLPLYCFLFLFALVVCVIGGWKGAKALAGLAYTFVAIFGVMFPLMYRGWSPILLAIAVSAFSTIVTLVLLGGGSRKTCCAVIGTTSGVVASGLAAKLFGFSAGISGFNVSNIDSLLTLQSAIGIRIGELLFAGIIISSLGAVMDVGMSISSTIEEIHQANPSMNRMQLFQSGINVGKDMMGTMINTLILAYAGGSLSTLLLNYCYNVGYNQLMNGYIMGIEIMQGISGSLGVVLTIPITAAISSFLIGRSMEKGSGEKAA